VRPNIETPDSTEHHAHRLEGAIEGIEHQAEDLQGHDAKERLVALFSKNNRSMPVTFRQNDSTLRNLSIDWSSIRQRECHRSLRLQAEGLPILGGENAIAGTTVDQEADLAVRLPWTGYESLDECNSHDQMIVRVVRFCSMEPLNFTDRRHLEHAARLALRGHGRVEPNPMVGCVIVKDGRVVGWGCHRFFGGPHAEVEALERAGDGARGASVYLTLEPCAHHGKTPPCTEALLRAGVARVVIARRDPHPDAAGGGEVLRQAGVEVIFRKECELAHDTGAPCAHRVRKGLPWVVAKWAQTVDGRIATRTGESQWISNDASRRLVHRERGRVDAIMTGIGTVLVDDPLLTARGVRVRRTARRVVIDPDLDTPLDARLVQTASDTPTTIACRDEVIASDMEKSRLLRDAGVELLGIPMSGAELPLAPVLHGLSERHDVSTVMVDAGAGLLGRLFRQNLVNQAWVFIGPRLLGDEAAMPAVRGTPVERLTEGVNLRLASMRRRGDDVVLLYDVNQR